MLVTCERRAADPIVPLGLLRTRTVWVSSAALFLATAALFSITVFIPLYLGDHHRRDPDRSRAAARADDAARHHRSDHPRGPRDRPDGRYKRYPIIGLALMAVGLGLLAALAPHPSQARTAVAIAVFGLGFGMVGQVLIVAVQNGVDRRQLGVAMATTSFFRGLGGAVGAAILGAVFAAQAGTDTGGVSLQALGSLARADVIDGVQTVFLVAAPIAVIALAIVTLLREVPLQRRGGAERRRGGRPRRGRLRLVARGCTQARRDRSAWPARLLRTRPFTASA